MWSWRFSRGGPRRWRAVLAVAVASTTSALLAQQVPTPRGTIELITLDVRVLDKDGHAVAGLTAADFDVELDGKPAPVRALDYMLFATGGATAVPSRGSTPPTPTRRPGRSIIYGIDDATMRLEEAQTFAQAATRLVAALPAEDLVGLVTTSATGNVVASRDRAALTRALRTVAGRRPTTPQAADSGLQVSQQIDGLFDMIEAARALPAPRVVILCSNGIPLGADRVVDVEAAAEMAARAEVQVEWLTQSPPAAGSASRQQTNLRAAEILGAPIHRVASAADADRVLDEILQGWAATYRLSVEPAVAFRRSTVVTSKVVARREGLTVRASRSASLPATPGAPADPRAAATLAPVAPAGPPPTLEETLQRAAETGPIASGVTIVMASVSTHAETGVPARVVSAEVSKDVAGPLRAHFAIVDAAGAVLRSSVPTFTPSPTDDYHTVFSVPAIPGAARLRLAVADATGAVGVTEEAIGGQTSLDDIMSDVLVTWIDEDGASRVTALDTIPAAASVVQVMVESYQVPGATTFAVPTVLVTLTRVADGEALEEWTPQARMARASVQVAVSLPWTALPPGAYRVTFVLTTPGSPEVVRARTLSKRPMH